MKRRAFLTHLTALGTALLVGCGEEAPSQSPKLAPDFALATLEGKPVRLSDYRGKVVLVDFWGTYCPPCMEAIPHLVKLRDQLHPAGFEIIGVACDQGPEGKKLIAEAARKLKISYPLVRIDDKTALDYNVDGLPALFLIDRQGMAVDSYVGATDHQLLEARVRGLVEDGGWRAPAVR